MRDQDRERVADPPWPQPPPGWRHDAPDPPDAFAVPWGVGASILLVGWSQLAQLLVVATAVGVGILSTGQDLSEVGTLTLGLFGKLAVLAGLLYWWWGRHGGTWRLLGPVRPTWRHVRTGLAVGASGYVVVILLLQLFDQLLGPFDLERQQVLEATRDGGATAAVLGVVLAVLIAPVTEEVIFRGALFASIRHRAGLFPGMVLSGLVFGFIHYDLLVGADGGLRPGGFLPIAGLVLLGVWLAAAFHRSGSLVVSVVGHATFNAITLVLALTVPTG